MLRGGAGCGGDGPCVGGGDKAYRRMFKVLMLAYLEFRKWYNEFRWKCCKLRFQGLASKHTEISAPIEKH